MSDEATEAVHQVGGAMSHNQEENANRLERVYQLLDEAHEAIDQIGGAMSRFEDPWEAKEEANKHYNFPWILLPDYLCTHPVGWAMDRHFHAPK